MKLFLKLGYYLFHPAWIPFLGATLYFMITPRYFPKNIVEAKLLAIAVATIFVPLSFTYLVKKMGLNKTDRLKKTADRRVFLLFYAIILVTINNFVLHENLPELYYFFTGLLLAVALAFVFTFLSYRVSLHMLILSAVLGFLLGLSALYSINILSLIAGVIFALGWTGTALLGRKKHQLREVITGIVFGLIPQILFFTAIIVRYKI